VAGSRSSTTEARGSNQTEKPHRDHVEERSTRPSVSRMVSDHEQQTTPSERMCARMHDELNPDLIRPTRRDDILTCATRDEIVLYDPKTDTALGLNLSASVVWSMCDGTMTIGDISRELAKTVAAEAGGVSDDVMRVIAELQSLDVLILESTVAQLNSEHSAASHA